MAAALSLAMLHYGIMEIARPWSSGTASVTSPCEELWKEI